MRISEPEDNIPELEDTPPAPASFAAGSDHVDRVLAQWAGVRPDLDTTAVAVIARLGRVTSYIDAAVNTGLAEFDLTRSSWDVLASLRRSGPPYRLSPTQLYRELMRSSGAMTHRLAGLGHTGLIRRIADPQDGRGLLVELTRKGVEFVDHVAPKHLENERSLLAPLSNDEQAILIDHLRKLLSALEHEHPSPPSGLGGRHRPRPQRHQARGARP